MQVRKYLLMLMLSVMNLAKSSRIDLLGDENKESEEQVESTQRKSSCS